MSAAIADPTQSAATAKPAIAKLLIASLRRRRHYVRVFVAW
jgi:hypothetical protein